MELKITGVGQTYDFESGVMRDYFQVMLPSGATVSVDTNDGTVQQLIKLAADVRETVELEGPSAGDVSYNPSPDFMEEGVTVFGGRPFESGEEIKEAFKSQVSEKLQVISSQCFSETFSEDGDEDRQM
jgi:hypothetical protein